MRVIFTVVVAAALLFSCTGCGRLRGMLYGPGAPCAPPAAMAGPTCSCAPAPTTAAMPWSGVMDGGVVADPYGYGVVDGYAPGYEPMVGEGWSASEWIPRGEQGYVPGSMTVTPSLPAPGQ